MVVLIDDFVQYESNDSFTLYSSPQLFETITFDVPITLRFTTQYTIDCIGLGNCNSSGFSIFTADGYSYSHIFNETNIVDRNGLYQIPQVTLPFNPATNRYELILTFDSGSTIGRIGCGIGRQISTAEAKEIGFSTTRKIQRSQSGAVLPSISEYASRVISLTAPYQITPDIYNDFRNAYETQISKGFPMFILFDKSELVKFGAINLHRFYGSMQNNFMLQSSVHPFLYGLKFTFTEAF